MAQDPEILPPRIRTSAATDEALDHLATLLDSAFEIPGTRIRYGLDGLIGLIPGLGDIITGLMSLFIVFVGWQRGISRITQARMLMNIVIDTAVGAVPILGDAFDVAWKANLRNVALLERHLIAPQRAQRADRFFIACLIGGVMLVIAGVLTLGIVLTRWLFHLVGVA